ncbi:fimbrial protein [Yersinia aldovae]|uniref:fimbrial protein n=1 Tax=Yersinia aldovae TaxID=29483 RepID=UPI0005E3BD7F|nr:hypothetical protein [Yersinia aldovae]CNI11652.1 fimbrial protein [Yersinia aldovae]
MNILRFLKIKPLWIIKLMPLLIIALLTSHSAYALVCKNADNGSAYLIENIGSIAVPQSLPDGTTIWRSENRTMRVQCWKERGQDGSTEAAAENIYIYMDPGYRFYSSAGIDMGVTVNGITYPIAYGRYQLPGIVVPYCDKDEATCRSTASVTFSMSYYVYVNKQGTSRFGNYPNDALTVFQIDGSGGLNSTPNSNFTYNLNGLSSIRFIQCDASVTVTPNNINFGDIVSPVNFNIGATAKTSNFKATVSKYCDSPFTVTAVYSSPAEKNSVDTLDLKNGLGLKVKNLNTNTYIQYGDVSSFADLTTNYTVDVPFQVELLWIKSNPTIGVFNTSITITVYYN